MKKVRMFLASSSELDYDKKEVELFIARKNKDWHDKRIYLELTTWKDFISSMTDGRMQDEYNKYIHDCDIAIFLFNTKLGRYTKEEFDAAHKAFMNCKDKIKRPRIYTYFKTDGNESQDIKDFRNYIDNLGHFYDTYESMDDLFVKFNRQLDMLENEGKLIIPERIDVQKIIKYAVYYFLLPVLVLSGIFFSYYYYQPTNLTIRVKELNPIPALPFKEGNVTLTYGDKTEVVEIKDEVIFKQIPSKYKGDKLILRFSARGYMPIDTLIELKDLIQLPIRRDNSFGKIFGIVQDEYGIAISNSTIFIDELKIKSDSNGRYILEIPREKQAEEQRIRVYKNGYENWDKTLPVLQNVEIPIVLKKD